MYCVYSLIEVLGTLASAGERLAAAKMPEGADSTATQYSSASVDMMGLFQVIWEEGGESVASKGSGKLHRAACSAQKPDAFIIFNSFYIGRMETSATAGFGKCARLFLAATVRPKHSVCNSVNVKCNIM